MRQINIKEYFNQEMDELRRAVVNSPSLLIIDATDNDPGNQIYIKKKVEDFTSLGWPVEVQNPINDTELKLTLEFAEKNRDTDCVIVQMPTAERFNFSTDMLPVNKDCDGLHPLSRVMPATVRGIIDYLDVCEFEYSGKTALVIGRSDIVGKPMAKALLDRDMTVAQCHSKSNKYARNHIADVANLIVCATGKPKLISRLDCNRDTIVIDVGITRDSENHLVGDFLEINAFKRHGWSTPVPGGVGLLTRLGLIKNCLDLTKRTYKQISIESWQAEQKTRLLEDSL